MAGAGEALSRNIKEFSDLLPQLEGLNPAFVRLADACMACWQSGGKLLIAGNGGSAACAMHFAEELVVRFHKNRRALAAIALCDPTVLTCAGNDFGYEAVFSRQVEALGSPGDLLIVLSTSGNSINLVRAVEAAKARNLLTVFFGGKDGGKLRGQCDIELIVPSSINHHVQEAHEILYHALCQWIDEKTD